MFRLLHCLVYIGQKISFSYNQPIEIQPWKHVLRTHLMKVNCHFIVCVSETVELYRHLTHCLSTISQNCSTETACVETLCTGVVLIHDLVTSQCRCKTWHQILTDQEVLKNLSAFIRHQASQWNSR